MHRALCITLLLFLATNLWSQVIPKEGSSLNYRMVGFSFPLVQGASGYTVEIAQGIFSSEDSFKKNTFSKTKTDRNRVVAKVPSFGHSYTWRVVYAGLKQEQSKSSFYHFSTAMIPEVDTNIFRLNVSVAAKAHGDAYVFVDGNRALYNMKGRPVWYLPHLDASITAPRDLKLTPFGTITCLIGNNAYEVSYDGEVLWKGPNNGEVSGDLTEDYHHELTRLKNGNYMVLGSERVLVKKSSLKDNCRHYYKYDKRLEGSDSFMVAVFGTIIEYDRNGKVVWSWKSSKYFENAGIDCYTTTEDGRITSVNVHQNAFYFDEKSSSIYVSFKNINRVVKLKYPSGEVLNEYGDRYENGSAEKPNGLFCGQHCCGKSQKGYLYTFNNNDCNPGMAQAVVMMREGLNGSLEKVWEYAVPKEQTTEVLPARMRNATTGGNVTELADLTILAMVSNPNCRILLLSPEKEVLWSAMPERWSAENNKWEHTNNYRARMIYNPKNFEHLVWGEELKDLGSQN